MWTCSLGLVSDGRSTGDQVCRCRWIEEYVEGDHQYAQTSSSVLWSGAPGPHPPHRMKKSSKYARRRRGNTNKSIQRITRELLMAPDRDRAADYTTHEGRRGATTTAPFAPLGGRQAAPRPSHHPTPGGQYGRALFQQTAASKAGTHNNKLKLEKSSHKQFAWYSHNSQEIEDIDRSHRWSIRPTLGVVASSAGVK